jgi:hypothetical protein
MAGDFADVPVQPVMPGQTLLARMPSWLWSTARHRNELDGGGLGSTVGTQPRRSDEADL